jgi:NADPH:quinone reductase-like Zn-dependent oxidoreductase
MNLKMKAIIWTKYGPPDVLQLREVKKPSPKDDEILVRVYATTVTAGDCEVRGSKFPMWLWIPMRLFIGLVRPKRITTLGQELSGEIEEVGKDVKLFKKGDKVFAHTGFRMGAYSEYICLPEKGLISIKPEDITHEEATTVPTGGLEALYFMRKANIQKGQKLLINGAGGSIGTYAIQIAKHFGAEITGVDSSEKLDMLSTIGADNIIDYKKEDFTKSGKTYDAIFDVVGKSPFSGSIRALRKNGRYLLANPRPSLMIRGLWTSMRSSKKVIVGAADQRVEDLDYLKELIESGKIKPVIDKSYPLEQIVEAHKYVEKGHKKGNLVITLD